MACYHPSKVNVLMKPNRPGAKRHYSEVTVGCGNCIGCRADQARDWTHRILNETDMHDFSWFVTLTYDEENLPENHQLHPAHLRRFFKTLRRTEKLRYFAVGEYGEITQRPHYHALLFGPAFLDNRIHYNRRGAKVWRSETLESAWGMGLSELGTVTPASAAYCAGYVQKKLGKQKDANDHHRVDVTTGELVEWQTEFSRMSLRPAIGATWIKKYWRDVYPRDYIVIRGREFRPPRYYDKWMEQTHDKDPDCPCEEHQAAFNQTRHNRIDHIMEIEQFPTDFELASKKKHHRARNRLFRTEKTL